MSANNFFNILKTISEAMSCPSCNHGYQIEEVQFISQMEGYSMVHLTCSHCKIPVWFNIFASDKKPTFRVDFFDETKEFGEITSDEIISFHNILKNFDGDFRRVFSR